MELSEFKKGIKSDKEDQVSLRGITARHIVQAANHLPGAQDPARRARIYEREPKWKCPQNLELTEIDLGSFKADFMRSKPAEYNTALLAESDNTSKEKGIILQLHGGGYYEKIHNTYRDMAALYNELSDGWDVISPDYRVAPEDPYPAALEDALASYKWILEKEYAPENIIIAGDSAGGGLSLALTLYLRDHDMPLPAGIITMSAWTDLTKSGESYEENFNIDPIFGGTKETMVYMDGYYKDDDPHNPYISPIFGDMTGFPPMLMQVGDREVLLSDTLSVADAAKKAGVLVKTHVYPGMFHVFQMGLSLYPESKEAWEEVRRFIRIVKGMEKSEE
ncbi:MAG: putative acetyl-hydrolase LipR precursor [Firmicutes bacterium ADurb.Bin354]|nr:MAG: putative acetyl-hydrolase LipR precursor [Firmicutes bacterium ADurb.Bin354]